MRRLKTPLRNASLLLLIAACARTQGPGRQHDAYFPPPEKTKVTEKQRKEFKNLFRELGKGSGADRVEVRAKLMAQYENLLAPMLDALTDVSHNHFVQRQVCLVLMQMGDTRALTALKHLSGFGKGGTRGLAGLALGRLGDPSAVPALESLSRSGQPMARMMAYLALGRIGGRAAVGTLLRRLDERKPAREREAIVLALGLTGSGESERALKRILTDRGNDRLRRTAAVAAGYLDPDVAWGLLESRVDPRREEDKKVRIIALRGCSRLGPDQERFEALRARRRNTLSDADEEAAWVLALAAAGGEEGLKAIAKSALASPREEVRGALAAATVVVGGRRASLLASELLNGQEKDRVTRAALLAVIIHSRNNANVPPFPAFAKHTDEQIRRAALCGDVYLRGGMAKKTLRSYLTPEYKDDVRKLATQLLSELADDETAATMLCRARLQRLLDENGLAASWNLNLSATERLYEILDIEDAMGRRGSGQPPGARPSGRPAPPSATGPSPEQEDLRRHLDRYPYIDLRHRIEVPPVE